MAIVPNHLHDTSPQLNLHKTMLTFPSFKPQPAPGAPQIRGRTELDISDHSNNQVKFDTPHAVFLFLFLLAFVAEYAVPFSNVDPIA